MTLPELPWGIYLRTSTFEQGEKSSPLKQFMACVAWAKANGKTIPGADAAAIGGKVQRSDYVFVDAQSGTNDDRPDWQRFMALAKTGKEIGGVVCYVVDRAARNLSDAIKIHRELKRMRVGFKFALQHFDEGPAGVLMFQVFAAFAEYECKIIAERTHDGRKKRILGIGGKRDNKPRVQGMAQYGYRLDDGVPVEDEKEGPAARLMLRLALDGVTCAKIAIALNKAGRRTRDDRPFTDTWVASHLREAHTYAGTYRHKHGIEAAKKAYREALEFMGPENAPPLDWSSIEVIETEAYPAMITHDEASLILARVEKNRIARRGRPPAEFALAHYIWCAECNTRWYAAKGRYYCGCAQLGKPLCNAIASAPKVHLEAAFFDGMLSYLRRPEAHYSLALADYNANHTPSTRSRDGIEKEVRELVKKQAHYDEQATEYDLTNNQRRGAKQKSHALEMQIAELRAEQRRLSVLKMPPSQAAITAAFAETLTLLGQMATFEEKRRFVELTVGRIETDGRQVNVTGTFDVAALANTAGNEGSYSMAHLDSPLNKSEVIPFAFSAKIPGHRHRGRRKAA